MDDNEQLPPTEPKPKCGIIMPISSMDSIYTSEHWSDVLTILSDVIKKAGFEGDLVSVADEVSIIQKTIVQNLYNSALVICDISGRNANVMFELGIRLTFDRPTIIICDETTQLPFDTSMIEHIFYPKTLRYQKIEEFKDKLRNKMNASYTASLQNPNYSPFLKNFGEFTVPKLTQNEVPENRYILNKLNDITKELRSLKNQMNLSSTRSKQFNFHYNDGPISFYLDALENILSDSGHSRIDLRDNPRVRSSARQALIAMESPYDFTDDGTRSKIINEAIKIVTSENS